MITRAAPLMAITAGASIANVGDGHGGVTSIIHHDGFNIDQRIILKDHHLHNPLLRQAIIRVDPPLTLPAIAMLKIANIVNGGDAHR